MSISRDQRHTKSHRCPICDGAEGDPRGQSKRCMGFTTTDGYAHCSREDYAGGLDTNRHGLYAHRLRGDCKCGVSHGADNVTQMPKILATYDYNDENGVLRYQVARLEPKDFRCRQPDGSGGWIWNMLGVARIPYRLPELIADDSDRPVYIVEGEKDVDTLTNRGFTATCNPGGAGKWGPVAAAARRVLAGRAVIVVSDRDDVGRKHAEAVAATLRDVAKVRVVEPPAPHKDATDLLRAGGTVDDFADVATSAETPDEREEPAAAPTSSGPKVWTARDVVTQWVAEGPLAHMPTGFPTLDERTGGGPTEGCRVYLLGAPNAWKTALLVQLADVYEQHGCLVGFLCVDEEPGDLVTRFMQRRKWRRQQCELRDPLDMPIMLGDAGKMTLRIYTDEFTIEAAAEELAAAAKADGKKPVLLVDSVQTVRSARTTDDTSPREAVNHVVKAIRTMAIAHRMLVFAACEMNRGAYRSLESAEQNNDMAAGKESGAIEYAARLMLALRSVPKQKGMVDVRIVKNKLGTEGEPFFIQGEHGRMSLEECAGPVAVAPEREDTVPRDAEAVARLILSHPGMGTRQLAAKAKAAGLRLGKGALDAALEYGLDAGTIEDRVSQRGKVTDHHFYAVSKPSAEVHHDSN